MRHNVKKFKKFNNKDANHRDAMLRNLVGQLFTHKAIVTTQKRAKAISPIIDRMINVVNTDSQMNAIRKSRAFLYSEEACQALLDVSKKYASQKSGMTRITPVTFRDGDNAKMVKIELI